jgi:DNA topoisomerase-1
MLLDPNITGDSPSALAMVDPRSAAESAGLHYISDKTPGITRRKRGKGLS